MSGPNRVNGALFAATAAIVSAFVVTACAIQLRGADDSSVAENRGRFFGQRKAPASSVDVQPSTSAPSRQPKDPGRLPPGTLPFTATKSE